MKSSKEKQGIPKSSVFIEETPEPEPCIADDIQGYRYFNDKIKTILSSNYPPTVKISQLFTAGVTNLLKVKILSTQDFLEKYSFKCAHILKIFLNLCPYFQMCAHLEKCSFNCAHIGKPKIFML